MAADYSAFEKLCKDCNVKPATIARETGILRATFTSWKQGSYSPKLDKLQKIADYFGVPVDYFLGEENKPKPTEADQLRIKMINMFQKLNPADQQLVYDLTVKFLSKDGKG